jgi:hypothetical protein
MKRKSHYISHFQNARSLAAVLVLLMVMTSDRLALANDDKVNTRERFTEVDREIQAVKQEILEINREILSLEEELLYPQGQQLMVFVSITDNSPVDVYSISLSLDGQVVSRHDYTRAEAAALHNGGTHRLYVGRLRDGPHVVDVSLSGTATDGQQLLRRQSAKIIKRAGRKVMELNIAAGDKGTEPQFTIHDW